MPRQHITQKKIAEHVQRLGELYPPIPLDSVDRTIKRPAHLKPIQDIARLMYFLTGASTERQAVLAYNHINRGMQHLEEAAISETIITPIKQQEPGHFAFYQMSATAMIQDKVLRPWQLFLTRVMREKSYHLVGTNQMKNFKADMGAVIVDLDLDRDLEGYAREVGRVENRLLWAHKQGMDFPPYILKALRESVDLYRERLERGLKLA
jgi:hypothetical protein